VICSVSLIDLGLTRFLADRTNGRAYAIVLRPSPVIRYVLMTKRCAIELVTIDSL